MKPSKSAGKSLLHVLVAAFLLSCTVVSPVTAVEPLSNETDVAITILEIDDSGITRTVNRSPAYHDLAVTEVERDVTFRNDAAFIDSRDDGIARRLIVEISANDEKREHFTAVYTPPYRWEDLPWIEITVPDNGENPHEYDVFTHYRVLIENIGQSEANESMGCEAKVWESGMKGGD